MDNFYGPLSVRIYITPYLNWEKLGAGRGVTRKERGIPLCCPSPDYRRFVNLVYEYTYQRNDWFFSLRIRQTLFFKRFQKRFKRVSMGWWSLRLSAKILAVLRLSVNFFQLRLTKKLKINFFCFKKLKY